MLLTNYTILLVLFQEGEIWPNSQAEINIIFKPQNAQRYYSLTVKWLERFPTDMNLPNRLGELEDGKILCVKRDSNNFVWEKIASNFILL